MFLISRTRSLVDDERTLIRARRLLRPLEKVKFYCVSCVSWWICWIRRIRRAVVMFPNRPISYSTKEPGSSVIFIHFTHEVRSSGIRASILFVHIRKFYKMPQNVVWFRLIILIRISKSSILLNRRRIPEFVLSYWWAEPSSDEFVISESRSIKLFALFLDCRRTSALWNHATFNAVHVLIYGSTQGFWRGLWALQQNTQALKVTSGHPIPWICHWFLLEYLQKKRPLFRKS